jgi:hypothetical protein
MNSGLPEFDLWMENEVDNQNAPDPMQRFIETAELRGALGARDAARILDSPSSARIDFSDIDADEKAFAKKMRADWEEDLIGDSHVLAKIETSASRRRTNLAIWMRGQFALGKSARELISHAEKHDGHTANLLREIAHELQAA